MVRKGKTRETHRYRFVEKIPLRDGPLDRLGMRGRGDGQLDRL